MRRVALALLLGGACAACAEHSDTRRTDAWVGRWWGPEGTYLDISGTRGSYEITIKDLDRARMFAGSARNGHIEFRRDGKLEVLRPTSGEATGMKWLADKHDCLTIARGEGYCRD
jgi:hypothetical protein